MRIFQDVALLFTPSGDYFPILAPFRSLSVTPLGFVSWPKFRPLLLLLCGVVCVGGVGLRKDRSDWIGQYVQMGCVWVFGCVGGLVGLGWVGLGWVGLG